MPVDFSTDIGKVRMLSGDTDDSIQPFFNTDAELTALLAHNGQDVVLAAADALDMMATKFLLRVQKFKTLDFQTDGPAVAKELQARAAALRKSYLEGDDFEIISTQPQYADASTWWWGDYV